jgi:hypothetical protein
MIGAAIRRIARAAPEWHTRLPQAFHHGIEGRLVDDECEVLAGYGLNREEEKPQRFVDPHRDEFAATPSWPSIATPMMSAKRRADTRLSSAAMTV